MDHQNKVKFEFKWNYEGQADIKSSACDCGYKCMNYDRKEIVTHEDIWSCPKCKTRVQFVWHGMGWIPYIPINEKHANIEELLYNKKLVQS